MKFWSRKNTSKPITPIGEVKSVSFVDELLTLKTKNAQIQVKPLSPEIIRIRIAKSEAFEPDYSYAVVMSPHNNINATASWDEEKVEFATPALKLTFSRKDSAITVADNDNFVLLQSYGKGIGFAGDSPSMEFEAKPSEMFLGLGEKTGGLDKRGKKWTMWNTDIPYMPWTDPIYQSIPFVVTMRSKKFFGTFFDNTFKSYFDICKSNPNLWKWKAEGGEINLYLIAGPSLKDVTRRFYQLVGGIPMPPRWALGYHQSKYSYKSDAEVRRVARSLRDLEIPCDVIHLDIHYMRGYRDFTFDPKRFPNPAQLAQSLRKDGFRLICILDPGVKMDESWEVWQDGVKKDVFCKYDKGGIVIKYCWPKKAGWPDFGKESVREWWGEKVKFYPDNDIAGLWNDMNEPSMWNGAFYAFDMVVPTGIYQGDGMMHTHFDRLEPHRRCRNVYGMLEDKATREGLLKAKPNERPLVITRSGYAGVGRYAIMWTGDNASTWAHLRMSIPMLINLGICAEPIAGPDIGGFVFNCKPELYARWIQLGAFYPFCRTHTAIHTRKQEPYTFGKRVEEIARRYLTLRYRLLPYLYSLVYHSHLKGEPIWRALSYEFEPDSVLERIEDQVMVGPFIMLAPVLHKGAENRCFYLPQGKWYDFFTNEVVKGPVWLTLPAPLENFPIFVRAGAIIPLGPEMQYTDQKPLSPLTLSVYSGDGEFDFYDDDGISMEYEKGVFARYPIRVNEEEKKVKIKLGKREGYYKPPEREIIWRIIVDSIPRDVLINQRSNRELWKFENGVIECKTYDDGEEKEIEILY